ncbi:skin secretory protein xP2-like [Heterocephalus glaber]|uniref:Skin secretory protein xP2-like n=1 Tax=Heterocephalus glaber TaxID=10181 RepID=A0AAX6S7C1_HETGA|nr:skin secretory protein xP2-like [Heterocephalus glaber]
MSMHTQVQDAHFTFAVPRLLSGQPRPAKPRPRAVSSRQVPGLWVPQTLGSRPKWGRDSRPGFPRLFRTSQVQSDAPESRVYPGPSQPDWPSPCIVLGEGGQTQLEEVVRPVPAQDRGQEGVGPPTQAHWSDPARCNWGGGEATGGRRLQRNCAPVSHNLCKRTGQARPLRAGVTEAAAHTPARLRTAGEPRRAAKPGWLAPRLWEARVQQRSRVGSSSVAGVSPPPRRDAPSGTHSWSPTQGHSSHRAQPWHVHCRRKLRARLRPAPGHSQARPSPRPHALSAPASHATRAHANPHPSHSGDTSGDAAALRINPVEGPAVSLAPARGYRAEGQTGRLGTAAPSRAGCPLLTGTTRDGPSRRPLRRPRPTAPEGGAARASPARLRGPGDAK